MDFCLRVIEAECSLGLIIRDLPRYFGNVAIKSSTDIIEIAEDEGFLEIKTHGNNISRVLCGEGTRLFNLQFMFEQELLVVYFFRNTYLDKARFQIGE